MKTTKTTTLPLVAAESLSDCGVDDDGESEAGQDPKDDVLPQPAATVATTKQATPDLTEDKDDLAAQARAYDTPSY